MDATGPFVALAVAASLAAQDPVSRIRALGALQAVAHNSGLQAHGAGDGLVGVGADYRAWFRDQGVRYEPALGTAAPTTQYVTLSVPAVSRGGKALATDASASPVQHERVASYARAAGVEERFDVQPDGVELTWTFAARPAGDGDLVVRYAVHTSLGEPTA
ncbi:MAG TPA: hypothetical protein VFZ65_19955, partial [Planctomycetota bacterium]|nr:hypothetical protein [Planctomycetota bacterium]